MKHRTLLALALCFLGLNAVPARASVIEDQLAEIGSIPNEEIVVVQRKYTRKLWRSEIAPVTIGGIPFGTVRRTLFGGANYTLHVNDWFGWEVGNFLYSKTFFSSFTDDVNTTQQATNNPKIDVDTKKLLFLFTSGIQLTPFYGKMSTFSRWIAYIEPYFAFGAGIAKTEGNSYLTFYPGVGFRVFFREWFSMRLEFRDYMFTEQVLNRSTGQNENKFRQNYAFTVSLSFWFPKMPPK
jgi:outer membrane beta-barrel protein